MSVFVMVAFFLRSPSTHSALPHISMWAFADRVLYDKRMESTHRHSTYKWHSVHICIAIATLWTKIRMANSCRLITNTLADDGDAHICSMVSFGSPLMQKKGNIYLFYGDRQFDERCKMYGVFLLLLFLFLLSRFAIAGENHYADRKWGSWNSNYDERCACVRARLGQWMCWSTLAKTCGFCCYLQLAFVAHFMICLKKNI